MFGLNGNRYRVLNTLFALVDSLLVFGACLIANYTGFGGGGMNPLVMRISRIENYAHCLCDSISVLLF